MSDHHAETTAKAPSDAFDLAVTPLDSPAHPGTLAQQQPERGPSGTLASQHVARDLGQIHLPTISGYEMLRELGRGGMGVVYEARDLKLNRVVAFKMVLGGLAANSSTLVRFLSEAESLATFQHPNIVQIFDRGNHQGCPYITMEFCSGGSLASRIKENPLSVQEAVRLIEPIARGMAYAHQHNWIHRDLKPDNILFAEDGTPKVTDFGLAKRYHEESSNQLHLTQTNAVLGTPSYMAPEQATGDVRHHGPAVDIYALGAILYRLITGRPPFVGENQHQTIQQIIEVDPVSPTQLIPGIPKDLATICLKCLQK